MDVLHDRLMFVDGCVALPLKGNDEKDYVGLFDTSWNIVGEPIQCTSFDLSEGKLMVEQLVPPEGQEGNLTEVVVYDTKGTQIFSAWEKHSGSNGYFDFIEGYMGREITGNDIENIVLAI